MRDHPKAVRRKLRELVSLAYERDLNREIEQLASRFDEWRAGQLDPFDLTDLIHKFHNGRARELYSQYNSGMEELMVASAVARGLLSEKEVSGEVWPHIQNAVEFIKRHADEQERSDEQEPEE